jgi:hypothetical protein
VEHLSILLIECVRMGVFPRSAPLEVKWSGGISLGSEAYTLSKALAVEANTR